MAELDTLLMLIPCRLLMSSLVCVLISAIVSLVVILQYLLGVFRLFEMFTIFVVQPNRDFGIRLVL